MPELIANVLAGHLGALHPIETVLTMVLAFGPFLGIIALVVVRRRHEGDDEVPTGEPLASEGTNESVSSGS